MSDHVNATADDGTELTTSGIRFSDESLPDLRDYRDVDHGKIVYEDAEIVVYQDHAGYELNEWADAFGIDRGDLSAQMHDLARQHYGRDDIPTGGDPWSAYDPLVFVKDNDPECIHCGATDDPQGDIRVRVEETDDGTHKTVCNVCEPEN